MSYLVFATNFAGVFDVHLVFPNPTDALLSRVDVRIVFLGHHPCLPESTRRLRLFSRTRLMFATVPGVGLIYVSAFPGPLDVRHRLHGCTPFVSPGVLDARLPGSLDV